MSIISLSNCRSCAENCRSRHSYKYDLNLNPFLSQELLKTWRNSLAVELSADNFPSARSSLRVPYLNSNRFSQPVDALKLLLLPNFAFDSTASSWINGPEDAVPVLRFCKIRLYIDRSNLSFFDIFKLPQRPSCFHTSSSEVEIILIRCL